MALLGLTAATLLTAALRGPRFDDGDEFDAWLLPACALLAAGYAAFAATLL